jgi:predicted DNA-binding protein
MKHATKNKPKPSCVWPIVFPDEMRDRVVGVAELSGLSGADIVRTAVSAGIAEVEAFYTKINGKPSQSSAR